MKTSKHLPHVHAGDVKTTKKGTMYFNCPTCKVRHHLTVWAIAHLHDCNMETKCSNGHKFEILV